MFSFCYFVEVWAAFQNIRIIKIVFSILFQAKPVDITFNGLKKTLFNLIFHLQLEIQISKTTFFCKYYSVKF